MKHTLPLLAILLAAIPASFAQDAPGRLDFTNAPVSEVLSAYTQISGLELVIDSRIRRLTNYTTLSASADKETLMKIIEATMETQAHVVITKLDQRAGEKKKASVTINDALPDYSGVIDPNAALKPYSESADAKLEIKQALAQAAALNTPVLVVFGANWCGDCKMLEYAMQSGTTGRLLAHDFQIVKVNTGGFFDQNLDVAAQYGVPLEKGIPAVVILSTNNDVLYLTKAGELGNAKKMGDLGIYEFFKKVTASPALKK